MPSTQGSMASCSSVGRGSATHMTMWLCLCSARIRINTACRRSTGRHFQWHSSMMSSSSVISSAAVEVLYNRRKTTRRCSICQVSCWICSTTALLGHSRHRHPLCKLSLLYTRWCSITTCSGTALWVSIHNKRPCTVKEQNRQCSHQHLFTMFQIK